MNSWRWLASLLLLLLIHGSAGAQTRKPAPLVQIPSNALTVSRDGVDLAAWLPFGQNIDTRSQLDVSVVLASTTPVEGVVSVRISGDSQVTTQWPVAFGPGIATTTLVLPVKGDNQEQSEPKVLVTFRSRTNGISGQFLELPYERWGNSRPNFNNYGYYGSSVSTPSLYRVLILSDTSTEQWQLGLERVTQTTIIKPTLLPIGTPHLANFSLVILGKRAADILTAEQCATLAQWVRSGGQLLVTGGALSSPLAGTAFSNRFGITTGSTATSTIPVTIQLSFEEMANASKEFETSRQSNQSSSYNRYGDDYDSLYPFDLPKDSEHPDWREDTKTIGLELPGYVMIDNGVRLNATRPIYRRVEGMGTITTTCAVLEGLLDGSAKSQNHSWVMLPMIGKHWLRSADGYPSLNGLRNADEVRRESPPHVWQSVLTTWAGIAPINWGIVLGFLVAFFFVVTVVERLILSKLLKRLNWNWVSSLLIVIVFCLLAQTISYASRGLTSLRRSIVIEDFPIGSGKRTLTFNSATPSLNRTLSLTLDHGSLLQIPESRTEAQSVQLTAGMADTTLSTPSWTPCYFVSDSWDAQATGPFIAELSADTHDTAIISGTVRLEHPLDGELESACLVWNGQMYPLEKSGEDWKPQRNSSRNVLREVGHDQYQTQPKVAGSTMASVLLDCLTVPAMAAQSAQSFYPARVILPDYPRDYAIVMCRYRSGKLPELTGLKMETESIHLIRQVVPVAFTPATNAD